VCTCIGRRIVLVDFPERWYIGTIYTVGVRFRKRGETPRVPYTHCFLHYAVGQKRVPVHYMLYIYYFSVLLYQDRRQGHCETSRAFAKLRYLYLRIFQYYIFPVTESISGFIFNRIFFEDGALYAAAVLIFRRNVRNT